MSNNFNGQSCASTGVLRTGAEVVVATVVVVVVVESCQLLVDWFWLVVSMVVVVVDVVLSMLVAKILHQLYNDAVNVFLKVLH